MYSQESSPTPKFKSINSSVLNFLYSPTLTSIHDDWKNHSLVRHIIYFKYLFFIFFWPHRAACGILVTRPDNHRESRVLTTGLPGKSQIPLVCVCVCVCACVCVLVIGINLSILQRRTLRFREGGGWRGLPKVTQSESRSYGFSRRNE